MSKTFDSLQYYNFRLWITGNLFASTGIWMQRVAQDWLVLTVLTDGDAISLGVVTALQFLPLLVLSPWAGALADRLNRRHLLQATQTVTGALGFLLGILVITGTAELWMVYALAFSGGVASALDSPVRQAFVSELVPMSRLPNAVGLNSVAFNGARLIGPAASGLLIEWVGIGPIFLINGVLFLVPVVTLALMRSSQLQPTTRLPRGKGQIREGFAYVRSRPDLIAIFVLIGVVSAFGLNFQMTNALMATEVFHRGAGDYGALGSYMAIGSLAGALIAARRTHPRLRLIVVAALAFGLAEGAMALAPSYLAFAVLIVPTGLASLTFITAANAAVQISTPANLRGRVMSLYTMILLGSTPIGAPLVGWVGEQFGARWTLGVGAIFSILVAVVVGIWGWFFWDLHLQVDPVTRRLHMVGPVERLEQNTSHPGEENSSEENSSGENSGLNSGQSADQHSEGDCADPVQPDADNPDSGNPDSGNSAEKDPRR